MSFTSYPEAQARLHRSELAVPGANEALFEKAAASPADVVFLDLEDAVSPEQKEAARAKVVAALNDIDWREKTVMVRINGLDTHWMYRDVIAVVERCPRLDMLLIPKVGVPADVYAIDMLVTQIETATGRVARREAEGRVGRIGFEVLIETALGMANVDAIAQSSRRLEAMSFGVADYAVSTRVPSSAIGGVHRDYGVLADPGADGTRQYFWGDPWHAAQTRMLIACRAYGLRPIDGPYGDFSDAEGYRAAARRAALLGYDGKWAIHPSQTMLANEVFSPSAQQIERAKRVLAAMEAARREGSAAVALDGKLLDIASIKMAENLLRKMQQLAPR
jgi:malyl-CoA/(S)-citramalyl-CoA lyase